MYIVFEEVNNELPYLITIFAKNFQMPLLLIKLRKILAF